MPESTAASTPIVQRFRAQPAALPKHVRLRTAIVDAIQNGELPRGTKMVGERELSDLLGLSLGTTQKALGRLMDEGFLVRRQGHGTFVGSIRRPVARSWHFRFCEPGSDTTLPVFSSIVDRQLVVEDGPWSRWLGPDEKGYVLIRRTQDVGGKFLCGSDMYLRASRFRPLLRMAVRRITDTNLKEVLEDHFQAPTLQSDGLAHVVQLGSTHAALMGLAPRSWAMRVDIVARSFGREVISFQQMFVPPHTCGLRLDFHPPTAAENTAAD